MDNYKLRQIIAAKKTPKTEADKAGMSNLLTRLREKRIEAAGVNKSSTLLAQRRSNARRDEDDKGYDPYG